MKLLHRVGWYITVTLGVVAVAFVVWRFALRDGQPRLASPFQAPPPLSTATFRTDADVPQRLTPEEDGEKAKHDRRDTAQLLPKLKPGMTRTEVEGLIGAPAPADLHPAAVAQGKVTYSTTYEADLGPPPTVRPIGALRPSPNPKGRAVVRLEFDATKPGHPLLEIHYPDPLF
jgi:hypothetical protein